MYKLCIAINHNIFTYFITNQLFLLKKLTVALFSSGNSKLSVSTVV
uniref:Uncharacterized protein n=1 Tax=Anguilla anguilla TaxID=7936 RepID=A0A0E9R773_ANGAN